MNNVFKCNNRECFDRLKYLSMYYKNVSMYFILTLLSDDFRIPLHLNAVAMKQGRVAVKSDVKRGNTAQLRSIKKVIDQFPFYIPTSVIFTTGFMF